jgi:ABC-type transporter Mla subunit MlaD
LQQENKYFKFGLMSKFLLSCIMILPLCFSCKTKPELYYLLVNNSQNLQEDAVVRYKGFPVGKVKEIKLHNDSVLISVEIEKEFSIPENADIILEGGFLQTKYLNILPSGNKIYLPRGDTIRKEILLSDKLSDSAQKQQIVEVVKTIASALGGKTDSSKKDSIR